MATDETRNAPEGDRWSGRFDRPLRWLLLSGGRLQVSMVLLVAIFAALLVVGTTWELEMERLVDETRAVQALFNTLLGGIILFVSVVLSINIAVLGEELVPLRSKRTRIEESIEFQTRIETFTEGGVSPSELGEFFRYILEALRAEAESLRTNVETLEDVDRRRELLAFAESIESEVRSIEGRLRHADGRVSATLLAGLGYDYASHIYTARHIQHGYDESRPETDPPSLDNVIEILKFYATGRDYFTTLYFKREVRKLTQNLLILSLPVIVFTSYVLLAIDAGLFPPMTAFGIPRRLLYITIAYAIALSPYVLLSSYMLRLVTVSKHTLRSGSVTIR